MILYLVLLHVYRWRVITKTKSCKNKFHLCLVEILSIKWEEWLGKLFHSLILYFQVHFLELITCYSSKIYRDNVDFAQSSCCGCSVTKSCLTLCDPMNCSMPGLPVLHYLHEFAQTHVHWVGDVIQPSHPLSPLLLFPSVFPSISVFSKELTLSSRWLKSGVLALALVLLKDIHGWLPLGLTGLIFLLSKWLSPHSCLIFEPITDSSKWFFTYKVKNLQEVSK